MMERRLDGIFIRVQDDSGKYVSRCLTDCTWEEVSSWLNNSIEERAGLISVIKELHSRLRTIGDQLDLFGDHNP